MNLAKDQFYKGNVHKQFVMFEGTDREIRTITRYTRYTYESGTRIYDVDVRDSDGDITFHINCGCATEPHAIHREIMKRFGLKGE